MPNPKVIYDQTNKNKFRDYKPKAYENFDAYKHDIDRWYPNNSRLFYNSIIETANLNKDNKDIVKDCLAYMLTMYVLQKETGKSIRELTTKYAYSFSYYEAEKLLYIMPRRVRTRKSKKLTAKNMTTNLIQQ